MQAEVTNIKDTREEHKKEYLPTVHVGDFAVYFDSAKFDQAQRVALMLSKSTLIPEHYRGNMSNCFIAMQMATRLRMEPLMVMQKSYVIAGKPAIESQIGIAALNMSGSIRGRINFKYEGEEGSNERKCTASVIDADTGELISFSITKSQATKIGSASKNPNWHSLTDLMLSYRAATYLIRTHYPEVLMGLSTKEEMEDLAMKDVTPSQEKADELNAEFVVNAAEVITDIDDDPPINEVNHRTEEGNEEGGQQAEEDFSDIFPPEDSEKETATSAEKRAKALLKHLPGKSSEICEELFEKAGGHALLKKLNDGGKGLTAGKVKRELGIE